MAISPTNSSSMRAEEQARFDRYARKYQDRARVARYDTRLFTGVKGRVFVAAEKRALAAAFRYIRPGGRVLDMPCGTGRVTQLLLDRGFDVAGADISEHMLRAARQKLGHYSNLVDLRPGNAIALDFDTGEFDAAVSIRFLASIPPGHQARALAELARVSRDVVIAAFSQDTVINRARRRLKAWARLSSTDYPVTWPTLREWARAAGLVVVDRFWPIRHLSEELILVMRHA